MITEILDTEKDYLNDLRLMREAQLKRVLKDAYVQEFKTKLEESGLITPEQSAILFSTSEELEVRCFCFIYLTHAKATKQVSSG